MKRRLLPVTLGTTLLALALGSTPGAAAPRPDSPTPPQAQAVPYEPLDRSAWTVEPSPPPAGLDAASPADDVIPVVAERLYELGASRGFARQETDYPGRAITLLWKGTPPADIAAYAAGNPYGVKVTIRTGAKYSRAEAEAARTRLLNSPAAARLGITWSELNADGSGVTVGVAARTRAAVDPLPELRDAARVPDVKLKLGVKALTDDALFSRTNDAPPWKGGIRTSNNDGLCSTGFAVLAGSTGKLLSASHCDFTGNLAVRDGAGQTIAPGSASVAVIESIDSMLIDPSDSPATTPSVFRGGYASTTTSLVKGWASNWPGDPVCSSGATTGEHCGTVYDDSDVYVNEHGVRIGVIQVAAPAGQIMGGHGDSGGPMFKTVTGGVQARGILISADINAGPMTNACGTVNPDAYNVGCSRWINYVPISTVLNTWGVSLEVG
ncbi:S1 family peptidase [Streptomyces sp. NPDC056144]|uniref:S1 family peptidase n=1 Tax=unclassified Streptomyces TaxID=2593676 RepID=UPI0035D6C0BE